MGVILTMADSQDLWEPKRRIERAYQRALKASMGRLGDLLNGLSDPIDIIRVIRDYAISRSFSSFAEAAAAKMVTHLFTDAGRTWRQAARRNSQGRLIYEALRRELQGPVGAEISHQIRRNAELIKSLPLDIAVSVNEHILSESLKGTRASSIADQIRALFPEKTEAKANLIARTETSKTATALTQARSQSMGVQWYRWRTARDNRVRHSHRLMDGCLVQWNDPPNPELLDGEKRGFGNYNCGEIFNCRCYPEPVIELDLINWPAKVYYQGVIQRMTRKQFESIMGGGMNAQAI
jgi:SPP1 gp7 family putative phage head morphogenesis protein